MEKTRKEGRRGRGGVIAGRNKGKGRKKRGKDGRRRRRVKENWSERVNVVNMSKHG